MTLAQRLSLLWRRFSPLEERLFATVRGVLPVDARSIFDAQLAAITHAQRLHGWTEIDYYRRKFGRVDWSQVPRFPLGEEFPLARVRFAVDRRRYQATLSSVDGHIFDFGITPSPQRIAFSDWDSAPSAELVADPLSPSTPRPPERIVSAWQDVLRTGAPAVGRMGWVLYDAHSARRITLDSGEFLILSERDGDEFIMQRTEPPSASLFWLASHEGTPEVIQGSISALLRRPRTHHPGGSSR